MPGTRCDELAGRIDSVDTWHVEIHHHDVWDQLDAQRQGLLAVGCFANHQQPAPCANDGDQSLADEWVVVDHEHTSRFSRHSDSVGRTAWMHVPPS